jgi:hypothetical protein
MANFGGYFGSGWEAVSTLIVGSIREPQQDDIVGGILGAKIPDISHHADAHKGSLPANGACANTSKPEGFQASISVPSKFFISGLAEL